MKVKHPEDKPYGYTGFAPRLEKEERMLETIKPPVDIKGNGFQIPGYTGYIP
jgi:hypothetical protein